ncbi:PAS domain S-box protein [Cyanobacterium aponinum AL20118]|uniref:histidine kinase n=1 Tax=Cyanobacterium aponinum AL20115 TaxID=3090662 RepID=A0AAF1C3V0_9CHRO|nr:PAS domain S-box protein [Cyanobacterium aponinum]WPF90293.1 PAS domain S-box protein [Cyanobacterium aponinum AL20115]
MFNNTEQKSIKKNSYDIKDMIDYQPLTVSLETKLSAVIALMSECNNHCSLLSNYSDECQRFSRGSCVLVIEKNKVKGIITERDLVRLTLQRINFNEVCALEVMTTRVITLSEDLFTDIFVALSILRQNKIRHLPIVNKNNELVGIVNSETIRQSLTPNDLLKVKLVEEIMVSPVITASLDSSVEELAVLMNFHQISCVIIVGAQGVSLPIIPLGIVTERDILQYKALGLDLSETKAKKVMSSPVFSISPSASLWELQKQMETKKVRHLVCCNKRGELVGVVTQTSLLRSLNPIEMTNVIELLRDRIYKLENQLKVFTQFVNHEQSLEKIKSVNILMIEDNATTVEILKRRLGLESDYKFNIIHYSTLKEGKDAVTVYGRNYFNLVILDLNLTDSQGLSTLETFKENFPEIATIVLTAEYQKKVALNAIKKGAQDYLIKSIFLGKKNIEQDCFILPLLTAIERQEKENKIEKQNIEIYLTNEKLKHSLSENKQIKKTLEDFNLLLNNRVKQRTSILRKIVDKLNREIKERKQIEKNLTLSENKLDRIINDASDGILIVDSEGTIVFANAEATRILQKADENIIGNKFDIPIINNQPLDLTLVDKNGQQLFEEVRVSSTEWEGKLANLVILRNINKRIEYEQNLAENEEKFRQLAENIEEVFYIFDIQKNQLIYLSSVFQKIWGLSQQKVLKNPEIWLKSIHPSDYKNLTNHWLTNPTLIYDHYRENTEVEYRIIRPDKKIRWINHKSFTVEDKRGSIYRIVGILTDITERRQTQEYLQQLNRELEDKVDLHTRELLNFKSALDQSAIVTISDPYGNITYVNDQFCQISGYSQEELLGQNHRIVNSHYHPDEFWQEFWMTISQGNIWRGEVKNIKKNGGYFWVDMVVVPFFDHYQAISQYIAIRYDITERKEAQEIIERNLATFDVAADGLAILEGDRYIYMNRVHLEMFGYSSIEDLPENNWRCLYETDQINLIETEIFPLLMVNKKWTGEAIAKRKDGTTFPEELSLTLTDKGYLICVCRDITQRKKSERQLREALAKAEEVNELKSRLITLTSHEFRTPLTVIASSVGILKSFGDRLSPEQQAEHFNTIETYIQHTTQLLDDILLINRSEARQLHYQPQQINIKDFCLHLVNHLQNTYGEYQIIFEINNESSLQEEHYNRLLDPKLLNQILTNLVSNSVKYSGVNSRIDVLLIVEAKNIILQVKDRGIGIPVNDQKYLFDTFYRGDNVGNIQGTGLGLTIVKECVNLCKGTITFTSVINQGTTFSINIPC